MAQTSNCDKYREVAVTATTESTSATTVPSPSPARVGIANDLTVGGDIAAEWNSNLKLRHRLKKDIVEIENCVEKVKKLRGVNFKWIQDDREDFGVIMPRSRGCRSSRGQRKQGGMKSVDYSRLTTLLIQAVKEQQVTIENQQQQIDELKKMVTDNKA